MKLFNFIIIVLCSINTTSFIMKNPLKVGLPSSYIKIQKPKLIYDPEVSCRGFKSQSIPNIQKKSLITKTKSFLKIIRYKNILPTLLLSFSGGWIMNPSMNSLFHSSKFIISSIITVLIMGCSMIINDVFDINIDKINKPSATLVTGEITMKEAKMYIFLLLSLAEYLNLSFLPYNLQVITHIAIINIILYTPIFKSILLIKNISCALLVGFAVVFSGLTAQNTLNIFLNKNIKLLVIASRMIFFGSLHNEILLDMTDVEGDSINNVNTLPVIFGNNITWQIVYYITKLNVLWNTFDMIRLFNFHCGMFFMLMCTPLIINLKEIKKYNYNHKLILHTVNETNKPLILNLLLLCILSIPRYSFIHIPIWF